MCPLASTGGNQLAVSSVDATTTDSAKVRGEVGTTGRRKTHEELHFKLQKFLLQNAKNVSYIIMIV